MRENNPASILLSLSKGMMQFPYYCLLEYLVVVNVNITVNMSVLSCCTISPSFSGTMIFVFRHRFYIYFTVMLFVVGSTHRFLLFLLAASTLFPNRECSYYWI